MIKSVWQLNVDTGKYLEKNKNDFNSIPDEAPEGEIIGDVQIECGPILKLLGTFENGQNNYRGSLMIVVKDAVAIPEISYVIGPSSGGNTSQLKEGKFPGTKYYEEDGFSFFRYDINFDLVDTEQKVAYAINSETNQSYQFFIPALSESMNVMSFSCNGFSLATDPSSFKNSLWYDVLAKHQDNHYHVMLGGGDQIYADAVKLHSQKVQEWLDGSQFIKKRNLEMDDVSKAELEDFYLNHYMAWFGKGYWVGKNGKTLQSLFPAAMAQIPSVNIYDDHDIIDGFGSYRDMTMRSPMLLGLGNVAYKYYMLFQHQINPDEDIHTSESSWILGDKPGEFIHQRNHSLYLRLGKKISLLGLDCRTERKLREIVRPSTYKTVFDRLNKEIDNAPDVKHLMVMLGVPILYPRLVWLEWLLNSALLYPVRKIAQKGIAYKGLVNELDGTVEVLDDLNDHWCAKYHKTERNKLIKDLIEFGSAKGVRITILSGDVHLCCIGRMKSKFHHNPGFHLLTSTPEEIEKHNYDLVAHPENDPRLMFNVISSAIVNGPPPDAMANLLNKRTKIHHFDKFCDEDMVPIFQSETNGSKRSNHRFMNQRNWSDLILADQSKYKDKLNEDLRLFPRPLNSSSSSLENHEANETYTKYPLQPNSLVTTIHVEDDPTNYESKVESYELIIPQLAGKYKLTPTNIKHLIK